MTKNDAQQKYLEFQVIAQQLNKLNQHFSLIDAKINELRNLNQNLAELVSVKQNENILVPFGAGILVKAQIKDIEELLMNVGSNIVVKKSVPDSQKIIQQQISELENALEETEKEIINLNAQLEHIKKELKVSKS